MIHLPEMESAADKTEKQARIWPWVLIAIITLLLVVIVTLFSSTHTKPLVQVGHGRSSDFEGEFWASNSSARTVMLAVESVETNTLGEWRSSISGKDTLSMGMYMIPPHERLGFDLNPPFVAHAWRARFTIHTEAKGWEIYWWYVKACGESLLHGHALPQFPKSQVHVFTTSGEVLSPVVSSK